MLNSINQTELLYYNYFEIDTNKDEAQHLFFWNGCANDNFAYQKLDTLSKEDIENSYDNFKFFTPVPPLNLRFNLSISIIKGENNEYIFKENIVENKKEIINPLYQNEKYDFSGIEKFA